MLPALFEALYYGLKAIGLWEGLLTVHKAKEAQDVQTRDVSLSDDDAVKRLHAEYNRKSD
jgi:hypothetical protein